MVRFFFIISTESTLLAFKKVICERERVRERKKKCAKVWFFHIILIAQFNYLKDKIFCLL